MKTAQFKALLASLEGLTPSQRRRLADSLTGKAGQAAGPTPLDAILSPRCPDCQSSQVVRNGMHAGQQRYLCKACPRTFNAVSGSPLSRLRDKDRFEAYADCMRQGLSVRDAAAKVGLSVDRAFRWRHRFLQSVVPHQPKGVAGMLEVDETYFRESQKGSRKLTRPARYSGGRAKGAGRKAGDWVPVLVGRVRGQPYTVDKVLVKLNGVEVTAALKDAVKPGETIVCTDGHSAFLRLQASLGVETKYFVASYHGHTNKTFHVQTANNYHEQLKTWIQRGLRGVATKYLPNYLAWHRLMTWNKAGLTTYDVLRSASGQQVINT
ncbi:IS1595 family transposase [Hydrogenophaga taeniospiralis]|uniref:IS1595 family transposase n=1 Tax=Hydrogenophaga taeniospiralis TaxID=65656 RepID=UPI001CFA873A|nr:IS1595 family transposase [Hydrogenophaga taeniospiralis]UCU95231.1 IS1595 family transposase [Hydrogenophaga taeniospiralis]UCU95240.1 IS1595 family transposase [Hydrogenophaga taeniospiralis]